MGVSTQPGLKKVGAGRSMASPDPPALFQVRRNEKSHQSSSPGVAAAFMAAVDRDSVGPSLRCGSRRAQFDPEA